MAQIKRLTFYLHFRDKQVALNEMMDDFMNEMGKAVQNPNFTYKRVFIRYYWMIRGFERLAQGMQQEIMSLPYTEMDACFISNAIVGLIFDWLKRGMIESPDEMGLWITQRSLVPLAIFGTDPLTP